MTIFSKKLGLAVLAMVAAMSLAGCETAPYNNGYGNGGYSRPAPGYGNARCSSCGTVQEVQQVYVERKSNGTLGAIIGAVAGGVLGNQVGKGDGRKAATVAGAVAGGVVGNKVANHNAGSEVAYRVTVRLDGGQYTTVTQVENPGVRQGDYVEVRGDHVYAR